MENIIDIGLYASYILVALCAIAAIVIPLVQSFGNPQSLVKSLIGIAALAVVFLVGYSFADGDAVEVSETVSKFVGAGIISMYILIFLALIGIVFTEVSKLFK